MPHGRSSAAIDGRILRPITDGSRCLEECRCWDTAAVTDGWVPMLARLDPSLPQGPNWVYEPKWDGFRALPKDGEPSVGNGPEGAVAICGG